MDNSSTLKCLFIKSWFKSDYFIRYNHRNISNLITAPVSSIHDLVSSVTRLTEVDWEYSANVDLNSIDFLIKIHNTNTKINWKNSSSYRSSCYIIMTYSITMEILFQLLVTIYILQGVTDNFGPSHSQHCLAATTKQSG